MNYSNQTYNYSTSDCNYPNNYYYYGKQEYRKYKKRKKQIKHNIKVALVLLIISAILFYAAGKSLKTILKKASPKEEAVVTLSYNVTDTPNYDYVDTSQIPEQLIDFMEKRPETADFVMSYPEKHDVEYYIDLTNEVTEGKIPLFIQWDERWGYKQYGDDFFALNGCGPTCLSMVCLGLGGDTKYDPYTVGQIMDQNDFYEEGSGSKWSIMTEGASLIGLYGEEIPLDEYVIRNTLQNGSPIICSMGEGDFTQSGHFIVLTGIDSEGNVTVNDPASIENSNKTWEISKLIPQIKNLWAFSLY